jgi:GAF domain-containing protein
MDNKEQQDLPQVLAATPGQELANRNVQDHHPAQNVTAGGQTATLTTETLRRMQAVTDVELSHLSLEELERNLLDRIRHLLHGDFAMILLLTRDETNLFLSASTGIATGFEEQTLRQILVPLGQGVSGRIAAERKPIIIDDLNTIEIINPVLRELGIRSLVGAPLMVKERVIGVVQVGTFRPISSPMRMPDFSTW